MLLLLPEVTPLMSRQRLERNIKQRMMRMGEAAHPLDRLRSPRLAPVVQRNIDTIVELRQEIRRTRTAGDRIADAITCWSGSMMFVYVHLVWFALWLAINLHLTPLP